MLLDPPPARIDGMRADDAVRAVPAPVAPDRMSENRTISRVQFLALNDVRQPVRSDWSLRVSVA